MHTVINLGKEYSKKLPRKYEQFETITTTKKPQTAINNYEKTLRNYKQICRPSGHRRFRTNLMFHYQRRTCGVDLPGTLPAYINLSLHVAGGH